MKKKYDKLYNLIYSIGAVFVFNAVLQIVIYPILSKQLGQDQFGTVIFWFGLINSIAGAVGLAINHERLVAKNQAYLLNGDCVFTLMLFLLLADVIFAIYIVIVGDVSQIIGICLALNLNIIRNYSDVEYRLNLNYKGYFKYYLILTGAYLLGAFLFTVTQKWMLVLCVGEGVPAFYALLRSEIYKNPFKMSAYKNEFLKGSLILMISDLIYAVAQYVDRIMLSSLCNSASVSIYYVGTLIGKTLVIAVSPLSNLFLSYLRKRECRVTKGLFLKLLIISGCVTGVGYLICNMVSSVFVWVLYPEYLDALRELLWLLNLGQILSVLAYFLNYILLVVGAEKWQFVLRMFYMITILVFSYFGVITGELRGLSIAVIITNLIQILLIVVVILYNIELNNKISEENSESCNCNI